jgi:Family of unknown function (DUF5343)
MAVPSAYLASAKNVAPIFEAIKSAGVPERFSYEFLQQIGFTSSSDRPAIAVMKALRFLDDNSVPTDRYKRFRDPAISGAVMAEALRDAYREIFVVNQKANEQSPAALAGVFKRTSGKGEAVSQKMATTFKALSGLADWSASSVAVPTEQDDSEQLSSDTKERTESPLPSASFPALHHDIHIHLPISTNVKVYDAIFRSLREHLG